MSLLKGVALFCAYVFASCAGLYLMKAAASWLSAKFMIGLLFYGLGAAVWLIILRLYPLSVAFPVASGALMIGTTLIAFFLLKEPVSMAHLLGIILIGIGIVILATKMHST